MILVFQILANEASDRTAMIRSVAFDRTRSLPGSCGAGEEMKMRHVFIVLATYCADALKRETIAGR
ncbi:MAG: hypothetical protein JWR49_180 [Tardiphaga sp.]|nr:hypothetical protein [Tardiphaga sp.]